MAIVPVKWLHFPSKVSLGNKPWKPSFFLLPGIQTQRLGKPPTMLVKQVDRNRGLLLTHLAPWELEIRGSLWAQGSPSYLVLFSYRSDDLLQNLSCSVPNGSSQKKKKKSRTLLISLSHCISPRVPVLETNCLNSWKYRFCLIITRSHMYS